MSTLYVNNIEPVSGSSLTLISASVVTATSVTSSFQGNLQGSASYSNQSLSSSYALTASLSITSSFTTTAIAKSVGATYTVNAVLAVTQAEYNALTPSATTLYFII
jgi:hypothetical protein